MFDDQQFPVLPLFHFEEVIEEVKGYPNYLVSNYGYILYKRVMDGGVVLREMTPMYAKKQNRYIVDLWKDGVRSRHLIHRLVAEQFLPNFDENYTIGFHNGLYDDCCVINLYMTKRRVSRKKGDIHGKRTTRPEPTKGD